jgi:hypothetical protein
MAEGSRRTLVSFDLVCLRLEVNPAPLSSDMVRSEESAAPSSLEMVRSGNTRHTLELDTVRWEQVVAPSSLDMVRLEKTSLTRPLSLCSKNLRPLVVTMPALSWPRCCSISSPSNSSGLTAPCRPARKPGVKRRGGRGSGAGRAAGRCCGTHAHRPGASRGARAA